jgi:hypothetical protein
MSWMLGHRFVADERQTVQQLISPVAAGGATPRPPLTTMAPTIGMMIHTRA